MRLLMLYFSGTGNTHFVAGYLAQKLDLPIEIHLCSVEQMPAEAVPAFDLLAVGFPVFAADAPPFFQNYLRSLPPGDSRGVFAFCTKGAFAGGANRRTLQQLAAQGYTPLGSGSVLMPGTDGLAFMSKTSWMARWAENKDFDQLKSADELAQRMRSAIQDLLSGQPTADLRVPVPDGSSRSLTDRLWRLAYERFTEPFKQRFAADERCNLCQICVRICPSGNIRLEDGEVHFADRCYLCMRCVHQCPQEAIQIGRGTVNRFRWQGPKGDFRPLKLYSQNREKEEAI